MFSNFTSTLRRFAVKTPQIQPVRFRYHEERRESQNSKIRRYGYVDHLARSGLMPHYSGKDATKINQFPTYK